MSDRRQSLLRKLRNWRGVSHWLAVAGEQAVHCSYPLLLLLAHTKAPILPAGLYIGNACNCLPPCL
jgi:hypothetical protein